MSGPRTHTDAVSWCHLTNLGSGRSLSSSTALHISLPATGSASLCPATAVLNVRRNLYVGKTKRRMTEWFECRRAHRSLTLQVIDFVVHLSPRLVHGGTLARLDGTETCRSWIAASKHRDIRRVLSCVPDGTWLFRSSHLRLTSRVQNFLLLRQTLRQDRRQVERPVLKAFLKVWKESNHNSKSDGGVKVSVNHWEKKQERVPV